jgi:hypothetical protein
VEKYDIEHGPLQKIEQHFPLPKRGQIVDCIVSRDDPYGDRAPWALGHLPAFRSFQVDLMNGSKFGGQTVRVRLTDIRRSVAIGEVMGGSAGKNPQISSNGGNERSPAERGSRERSGGRQNGSPQS